MVEEPNAFLRAAFKAAVAAADPAHCLPPHLPARPAGRTIVVGAGKAAAVMARAVESHSNGPISGLVVTRYGHGCPTERIEVVEAAHPVPDAAGLGAATRILDLVRGRAADDLVLCLLSGGGSALLTLPAAGLALDDVQRVTRDLLRCGASISEINCVRKHLSAITGGRLALAAHPAEVITLAISDVPGDDPAVIASGPTVADPSTRAEALAILARYAIEPPPAIATHLGSEACETPKPGDPRLRRNRYRIVASPQAALEAVAAMALARGIHPVILSDCIEGEAREVAKVHAGIARQAARYGHPVAAPGLILSGGETTVTVRGQGRGGRNSEFSLALALALDGHSGIYALAGDTDGIDGVEENAGAIIAPDTLARARARGLDPAKALGDNDAYGFFAALDDLVVTGPTLTNVNDFRAILVLDQAAPRPH